MKMLDCEGKLMQKISRQKDVEKPSTILKKILLIMQKT